MIEIKFYETNKPYGCFSNFAKYPILLKDKIWPTTEHYFQAQKFIGTEFEEEVMNATTGIIAAKMGRDRNKPLRKDWEQVKDDVMREAVHAKIEQYKEIRDILISTGNCVLVEHTINDSYWADGGNGSGKNMLGKILMEFRNNLDEYTGEFYLPQWLSYLDIHPLDMFWRMGTGETYVMKLAEWFDKLSPEAQKEYESYFTPPKEWENNF